MRLWVLPLLLLFVCAVFSQAYAFDTFPINATGEWVTFENGSTLYVNSTGTDLELGGWGETFAFNFQYGMLAVLVAMVAVGVIAGIQVIGSGLNSTSVKIIYKSLLFFAVWALLSAFTLADITAIPIFGWVLYFTLTLVYGVGVASEV